MERTKEKEIFFHMICKVENGKIWDQFPWSEHFLKNSVRISRKIEYKKIVKKNFHLNALGYIRQCENGFVLK